MSPRPRAARTPLHEDTRWLPEPAARPTRPPPERRDPIELLQASNDGRLPSLVPVRFGRMASSPFAFYRGAAALMAADLAHTPTTGLRVQACGDAHLMNFGGFATPERNIIFDINDLDETLPAPWEWDLKRLAASVVIAAQHLKLSETEAARAARDLTRMYRERMADYASMRVLDVWYDRIADAQRKNVPDHLFPKLVELQGAEHRIKDEPPLILHPDEAVAPGIRDGFGETLTFYMLPRQHHKHLKSTKMLERLNEEIKRRTRVVCIFPSPASCLRPIRALCAETHEAWLEDNRYINMELLKEQKKAAMKIAA